jgi:nucleoporin NUP82
LGFANRSIPASYIHSLAHFVSTKVEYLADTSISESSTTEDHSDLSSLYAQQLKYVNSLLRQIQSQPSSATTTTTDRKENEEEEEEEEDIDRLVSILSPNLLHLENQFNLKRQGPFLLQPSPLELNTPVESFACDINYINYSSSGNGNVNVNGNARGGAGGGAGGAEEGGMELGIFIICYTDGKVDIGLEVEKIEARWMDYSIRRTKNIGRHQPKRTLWNQSDDDQEEEEEEEEEEEGLPIMAIYETIDLGLASILDESKVEETLNDNWMTMVKDPLYVDTIYIYHALGTHCLILSKWLESIINLMTSVEEDQLELGEGAEEGQFQIEVERGLKSIAATDVLWILKTISVNELEASAQVEGLTLINDIYLGYSILIMTSSLQLVTIELSLRVDSTLFNLTTSSSSSFSTLNSKPKGIDSDPPAYLSLLDLPFEIPPLLNSHRSKLSTLPRIAAVVAVAHNPPPPHFNSQQVLTLITPESLRFLGKTVESFRFEIRDLVESADKVQGRLELQMKELRRQLMKLRELRLKTNELSLSSSSNHNTSLGKGKGGKEEEEEESLVDRLNRVTENQRKLLERTDRQLQRLSNSHQPLLSTYEIKWFEELNRLKLQVIGTSSSSSAFSLRTEEERGGGGGLIQRVDGLIKKVELLSPALEEMKEQEKIKKETSSSASSSTFKIKGGSSSRSNNGLGASQMLKLESMLSHE